MRRTYVAKVQQARAYKVSLGPPIAVANTVSGVHCPIGRAGESRPRLITASRSHSSNSSGRYELTSNTALPCAAERAGYTCRRQRPR